MTMYTARIVRVPGPVHYNTLTKSFCVVLLVKPGSAITHELSPVLGGITVNGHDEHDNTMFIVLLPQQVTSTSTRSNLFHASRRYASSPGSRAQ